jgi:hypothetical protein
MHLLPGTLLHLLIHPNSKELKKNFLPCLIADFLRVFVAVTMKVNYLDLIFQHFIPDGNILMLFFLLMYLKIKLAVLPFLILLAYIYPLGELETSLPSWLTRFSRSIRCVSAANVICNEIDIFNKNKIMLVDISTLLILTLIILCLIFC